MSTRNVNGLFMRTNVKVVVNRIDCGRETPEREASLYNKRNNDYYKLLLEFFFIMGYKLSYYISMQAI